MMCLCIFGVLSVFSMVSDAQEFRSDYNYFDQVQGWLKFHSIPANWNDARLRCNLEGAVLASPINNELTLTMMSMMEDRATSIFTGIHAIFSKGDYSSIEGIPLSAIPTRGSPDLDNLNDDESCLAMRDFGTLYDVRCQKVHPYICYKKQTQSVTIQNECGTTDDGMDVFVKSIKHEDTFRCYRFEPEIGSCYKFHSERKTWSRAYMTCVAEGGYLAIINSEKEARLLSAFASTRDTGEFFSQLGIHDWDEHGTWLTIHGQTLQDAGYGRWHAGEPSNGTDAKGIGEYCGCVFLSNFELNDGHCDDPIGFVCEKDPKSLSTKFE